MKAITIIVAVIAMLASFAFGYFRGYSDHSRTLAAFRLRLDQLLWRQLTEQQPDRLRETLRMCIYSDAEVYRAVTSQPLQHFAKVYPQSRTGDVTRPLEEADKITEGMTFEAADFSDITR